MAIDSWAGTRPEFDREFEQDAGNASAYLLHGLDLLGRLPGRPERSEREQHDAQRILQVLDEVRDAFLTRHARALYTALTDGGTSALRADDLVYAAAERVPGLTPRRLVVDHERERLQKDKDGHEIAQGKLLGHVLADPEAGRHLIDAMLRPTELALEHREELQRTGRVDLGTAAVIRDGKVGTVELRNPRHLNAEDDTTTGPLEAAIDLALLDPQIEVARAARRRRRAPALRRPADLRRRAQPHAPLPRPDLLPVLPGARPRAGAQGASAASPTRERAPDDTLEKLWIAAAETFAIGGGCQLLLAVDHNLIEAGTRCTLPARNEGIIPGAANLRLPRFVGDRRARQAILSDRELAPEELADDIVGPGEMDAAIERTAQPPDERRRGQRRRQPARAADRPRSRWRRSAPTWRLTAASRPSATSAPP